MNAVEDCVNEKIKWNQSNIILPSNFFKLYFIYFLKQELNYV